MKKTLNNLIEEYYETNESDQSFIKIVDYYLPTINYLVSNYRDKEDMKQEAILKIFNLLKTHKLDNLLNEPEYKIKAYLKISITNRLKDVVRKNYKHFGYEISVDLSEVEYGSIDLDMMLNVNFILEELIKKLSKKQKEVMRLIYLLDLKESQVAEILGVGRANISSLKNKAKKAINANLALNTIGDCETPLYEVSSSKRLYS